MKAIYPEETLALLAECDKHLEEIRQEYLHPIEEEKARWPRDPEHREIMLADPVYQRHFHEMVKRQHKALLSDASYQGYTHLKAKIISLSPCTYQIDANEVSQWKEQQS